jgi:hypothetical protein
MNPIQSEPVLTTIGAAVVGLPVLFQALSAFGYTLTPPQQQAIIALGGILAGFYARSKVTPVPVVTPTAKP